MPASKVFPRDHNMAMELSPQTRRLIIEEPREIVAEPVGGSDAELRQEVRILKTAVRTLVRQEADTRVKHTMLLEKCYRELKGIHERHIHKENQTMKIGGHSLETNQKVTAVEDGVKTLFEQMVRAKQAVDHSSNELNAKNTQQLEAFRMMREELDRFKFDVQAKAIYVESKFVPQPSKRPSRRLRTT